MMIMSRPAARDDEGAVLAMTLVVMTVVALLVTVILNAAGAGFSTAKVVGEQRQVSYAAEGAVDGAIQRLRSAVGQGAEGGPCDDFTLDGVNDQGTVTVDCEGLEGSGEVLFPGTTTTGTALRLVGTDPSEVAFGQLSNSVLRVAGSIEANSSATVPASTAMVDITDGAFRSVGACPKGKISATDGVFCAPDDVVPSFPVPPVTAQPVNSTPRTAPACNPLTVVQTLQPGTYTNAAALTALTSCAAKIVHFTPGVYYFNFPSSQPTWTINSTTTNVLGGTAVPDLSLIAAGMTGAALAATDLCNDALDGVQFIFGGVSRLSVQSGYVELCPRSADLTRTVIYGATVAPAISAPSAATETSGTWSVPDNALNPRDGLTASTSVTNSPAIARTAVLDLTGYGVTMPSTALVHRVQMRVRHTARHTAAGGPAATVTATIRPQGFPACSPVDVTLNDASATLTTMERPVLACLDTPAKLANFQVSYRLNRNGDAEAKLDGIDFAVSFTTDGTTPQTGCITAVPYGIDDDASRCAMLKTDGSNTGVKIRGSIFAPAAAIRLALPNASVQVLQHGMVARAARLSINPSTEFSGPIASGAPGEPTPAVLADRRVRFTARAAGVPLLTAVVTIDDGGGLSPGSAVTVDEWTVLRPE